MCDGRLFALRALKLRSSAAIDPSAGRPSHKFCGSRCGPGTGAKSTRDALRKEAVHGGLVDYALLDQALIRWPNQAFEVTHSQSALLSCDASLVYSFT